MGMIAYFATMSVNIADFTRYSKGQREQMIGQSLGLPPTITLFSMIGALTTSATIVVYGHAIWDPVELVSRFSNPVVVVFALLCVIVATVAVNVAANVVGPAFDFSNALPRLISFRTGGIIAGVIGILMQPWRLLSSPELYIFSWLGVSGAVLGSVAGVLTAEYYGCCASVGYSTSSGCTRAADRTSTPRASTGVPSSRSRSSCSCPSPARTPRTGTDPSRRTDSSPSSSRCSTTAGPSPSSAASPCTPRSANSSRTAPLFRRRWRRRTGSRSDPTGLRAPVCPVPSAFACRPFHLLCRQHHRPSRGRHDAPWNPANTWRLAALAMGCTAVIKPSPTTGLDSFLVADAVHEAGFPLGA
ncbi:hypothetical protein SHIRM173S_00178 [Streptomyces hirsutus]